MGLIKKFGEWNPFLSKEERAKRAEEARVKSELEKKAIETKNIEEKLKEYDSVIQSFNRNVNDLKLVSTTDQFYSYKVDIKDVLWKNNSNLKLSRPYLSLSKSYNDLYHLTLSVEFIIDKKDLEITKEVAEKLKSLSTVLRFKSISFLEKSFSYIFEIRISEHFRSVEELNNILGNMFYDGVAYSIPSLKKSVVLLEEIIGKIDELKKEEEKRSIFKGRANDIIECLYGINDISESYEYNYDEKTNSYTFTFNMKNVKTKRFDVRYSIPYVKSYGTTKTISIDKAKFHLDDGMLEFFFLLSEAKPRINDIIKDCQFDIEIQDGLVKLIIK